MNRWTSPSDLMRIADRLFDESAANSRVARLALDAYETTDAIIIEALVPGVHAEDLDIQVDGEVLTIRGELPTVDYEEARTLINEVTRAPFARTLRLNLPIEVDDITAEVENGVLILTLPKAEIAKPRAIKVNAK